MEERIRQLLSRLEKVENLLGEPRILSDQKEYRALTQEHAYLSEVKEVQRALFETRQQLEENSILLKNEVDPEFQEIIREEITRLQALEPVLSAKLETLLVPPDPNDSRNVILEIRAGTGGDEAAIFVGDCVRMYKCYAD
ncbi:MAG: PCRF domain-containing protein, partial [Verrucomicrobia bacterium]|nr:PCRF domain-containing protein [Verrucomicrobiota bacterium]